MADVSLLTSAAAAFQTRSVMWGLIKRAILLAWVFTLPGLITQLPQAAPLPRADGYSGIWYFNQPTKDEYRYKYSGGMATYPQQHIPIAVYCSAVNKTFFCYGGTSARYVGDKQNLLHMVSYFDHATGRVPRPAILLDKQTNDAHDNPVLAVDDSGFIWIFSPSHGRSRPSFIHRSTKPYSIDEFEQILKTNFSYPQPWHVPGQGFLFLHTIYNNKAAFGAEVIRGLHGMTSRDGRQWNQPLPLAGVELGDYQVSWRQGQRVGTAFDFHPKPVGLNARANIYYLETRDLGRTWTTITGIPVKLPVTDPGHAARVYDSRADGRLVFLKDLDFDRQGHPVILFLASKGWEPGPANDPREWRTGHWTGDQWRFRPVTTSFNNYDHGSLYVEPNGRWRIIAPTERGPQPYNPGGEIAMWTSRDEGQTWRQTKRLTRDSTRNHTYVRRPFDAHPDFYAVWADGDARKPSESFLYFTNRDGDHVWRLPAKMEGDWATPEIAW